MQYLLRRGPQKIVAIIGCGILSPVLDTLDVRQEPPRVLPQFNRIV